MNFAIRVDASYIIGIGHVMRCLTLADEMQERGSEVHFICRDHLGNAINLIKNRGYKVYTLPRELMTKGKVKLSNKKTQLSLEQVLDAKETAKILLNTQPDWVVVDHYSIDIIWHRYIYPYCKKIMVLDDLANRQYKCNLLLDPTFGRTESEYDALVPAVCKCLIGPEYALLRPQFAEFREAAKKKRKKLSDIKSILVTLGGNDSDNVIPTILDGLAEISWNNEIEINIVLAANAPHLAEITSKIKKINFKINILTDVDNMADIMLQSDIAIGAGGSTTWERCAMGLPSFLIICAQNQSAIVSNVCQGGAGINLGWFNKIEPKKLKIKIERILKKPSDILLMSQNSFDVCDGLGAKRVADIIVNDITRNDNLISFQQVTLSDSELIYGWQISEGTRKYFNNPEIPKFEKHHNWMKKKLKEYGSFFKIILFNSNPAGVLRIEKVKKYDDGLLVSIVISPNFRRKGVGVSALLLARKELANEKFYAEIHEKNIASIKLFLNSGYFYDGNNRRYISNRLDLKTR